MEKPPEQKKRGPKAPWSDSLGDTIKIDYRAPEAIKWLILERPVKRMLNKMATNEKFKARMLKPFLDEEEKK
jgi:hypothetical protein